MEYSHRIAITVFAELPCEVVANELLSRIEGMLETLGVTRDREVQRYWKIPEWFKCRITFDGSMPDESDWNNLLAALGTGWDVDHIGQEEASATWAVSKGAFCSPNVRFANIEIFPILAIRNLSDDDSST
ncbi:MAG: hypothetical protein MUF06_22455 [Pirellulaceae bacterium]|nr:hypothetical protein [Pirellulaceae bacterium]